MELGEWVKYFSTDLQIRNLTISLYRQPNFWRTILNWHNKLIFAQKLRLLGEISNQILLTLPGATTRAGQIPFVDAAFTSFSATCVTGLAVLDTPNDFTLLGQAISWRRWPNRRV